MDRLIDIYLKLEVIEMLIGLGIIVAFALVGICYCIYLFIKNRRKSNAKI